MKANIHLCGNNWIEIEPWNKRSGSKKQCGKTETVTWLNFETQTLKIEDRSLATERRLKEITSNLSLQEEKTIK